MRQEGANPEGHTDSYHDANSGTISLIHTCSVIPAVFRSAVLRSKSKSVARTKTYASPPCLASFNASIAAPRAPAQSPLGIT
jgi:hypothetical protein